MAKKTKRELVLKNGATFLIKGETARYYLCEETQFRKGNSHIAEVRKIMDKQLTVPKEAPLTAADISAAVKILTQETSEL